MSFSIIQKSQLEGAKRMDAEYYQPEYLRWDKKIRSGNHLRFGDLIDMLTDYTANGSFASLKKNVKVSDEVGYSKWIRIQNLDEDDFERNIRYIDKTSYDFLKKSCLFGGEILISKTGEYLGKAYLVPELREKATLADNIFLVHLKEISLKEFVIVFINSFIGRRMLLRKLQGSGQPTIIKDSLRDYLIPIPDETQSEKIKILFCNYKKKLKESKFLYSQAEEMILEELKLNNFQLNNFLSTVVNLSEMQTANRIDAEYFNSPCNKILAQVTKGKTAKLGDLVDITKGVEPGADVYQDTGKLFIRVSSISKDGIIDKDQKYLSDDLYNELKKDYQPQVGEVLLTKDASIGVACVVREQVEGIVAGGVLRLKLFSRDGEKMNPEYLALILNSIVGQLQAERDAGGSIIAHWKPEQIKNLVVPILPTLIQEKIVELVTKSHEARKKAKELLREAKLKVEEMIEKGGEK